MYAMIKSSGCQVIEGNIKIRISFYLEPGDARYEEHHVYIVDSTSPEFLAGYPGEVDEEGLPIDINEYNIWWGSLPRIWQDNPFHNHFIYIDDGVLTTDILEEARTHLVNFYNAWAENQDIRTGWLNKSRPIKKTINEGTIRKYQKFLDDFLTSNKDYEIRL